MAHGPDSKSTTNLKALNFKSLIPPPTTLEKVTKYLSWSQISSEPPVENTKPSLTHGLNSAITYTFQNSLPNHTMEKWIWEKLLPPSKTKILKLWKLDSQVLPNTLNNRDIKASSSLASAGAFGLHSRWPQNFKTLLQLVVCIHLLVSNKCSAEM